MKRYQMIVFFLIVFTIYFLTNLYIYYKGLGAIPALQRHRLAYTLAFFITAGAFIFAKILEARHSSLLTDILNIAGGFWLACMLYGFLFFLVSDLIFLILRIVHVIRPENALLYRKWALIIIASVSVILITGGFINALIPVVKQYDIKIDKPAGDIKNLRIAAVSDIHLGSIIRKRSLRKLSSIMDKLKPDLVLLLGDIVDGEIGPVMRGDLLKYFVPPHSKYGLLAITGNHEFIGGAQHTIPYIKSKGIRLLMDEIVTLDSQVQIIGRIDRDSYRFYRKQRKTLPELMENIDQAKPIILLDHQPFHYDEAQKYGVDLELSGHTHNGQLWPLNYVTEMIYELSWGYRKKGNTNFIVSCGYGLWGPRVRLASHSEILLINVSFAGD